MTPFFIYTKGFGDEILKNKMCVQHIFGLYVHVP